MYEVLAQHLTTTTGRPDFLEMFLHHLLTIALYCCSYLTNNQTIGVLVMLLHDIDGALIDVFKHIVEEEPIRSILMSVYGQFALRYIVH